MNTWREMARELGSRLANHAALDCGHSPEQAEGNAHYCPFCHDFTVYRRWYEKELRATRLERMRQR